MSEPNSNGEIRFGAFEVIPSRGELRKLGIRIKLPDQSFTVLLVLLEEPGAVVSREQLRKRLWGDDTFTDFEHGLNAAVNRLREALGDSVHEPKFIETLPKRGYRFVAPIENQKSETPENASPQAAPPAHVKAKTWPRWWRFALAALPLVAVGGWLLWQRTHVPVPPARLRVLTSDSGSETQPSLSPDGSQVAFASGGPDGSNTDIFVKLVGAGSALRLTTDPAADVGPAWSPDGKRIAFLRGGAGRIPAIYLISALGGDERKLVEVPRAPGHPLSWSPDGKWLAFSRGRGESAGIYLMPVEGGESKRITHPQAPAYDSFPVFSPDGRWLAFSGCAREFTCDVYLQRLDASFAPQGSPQRISRQNLYVSGITWTGDSLVYSGSLFCGMLPYLWRANVSGTGAPERLDIAGLHATSPSFSPATNLLAFTRFIRDFDIWRYTADGSHQPFITSSLADDSPQFSPDGKRIAFSSSRTGEAYEIWVANADGSHPVQLSSQVGRGQGSPRWSPDGRWIAFDSQRPDGMLDVYIIDATGGRPRRLDLGSHQNALPSWSRDGKWIYYLSDRTGRHELWRVPPSGGQPEQLTANVGHNAFESVDGKTLFYAKSDRFTPLFSRPTAGGPERKIIEHNGQARDFAVFEDGIYYSGRLEAGKIPLLFYQFSTGTSRLITKVEPYVHIGLTVSPDRRTILYTRSIAFGSDLMLIENFR